MPKWKVTLQARIEERARQTAQELGLPFSDAMIADATRQFVERLALSSGMESPMSPVLMSWEEAKAQSPGLIKYADAKAANPVLTIIDHLRDEENGYGKWTLRRPGLPRIVLMQIDKAAYFALNDWLRRDPSTGQAGEIPAGMYLPTRQEMQREFTIYS